MITKKLSSLPYILRNKKNQLAAFMLLLASFDIGLFVLDLLVGRERGIVFSYKLSDIILTTNVGASLILLSALLGKLAIKKYDYIKKWITNLTAIIFIVISDILLLAIYKFRGTNELLGLKLFPFIIVTNTLIIGVVLLFLFYFRIRQYLIKVLPKIKSTSKSILLSTASLVIFIVLEETLFYFLLLQRTSSFPDIAEVVKPNYYLTDSILGLKGAPNSFATHQKFVVDKSTHDSTKIFSAKVTTDSYGYRTVNIPHMHERKLYAIFMGCSFTFGVGVNDEETIPSYFAKKDSSFCAYNVGFGGWGPQNSLATLQFTNLDKIVTQDSGICIYTYIADHVPRAIGDMKTYMGWAHNFPYYDYKNDSLQYLGAFDKDRPVVSYFYSFISKSNFIKYFNINFPIVKNEKHYKLTCDLIYHTYLEYKKKFKNDNFYVLLYPNQDDIQKYLKNYKIKILDFNNVLSRGDKQKYFIEYDGHPTALANDILTDRLVRVVDSLKTKH